MPMLDLPLAVPDRSAAAPPTADLELAMRAAQGDERAFEAIMRRHNRLLFRTARSILKSDSDAEDAVQEAYLLAWRSLAAFRGDARLSTWLVRIVVNQALGRLRHHKAGDCRSGALHGGDEPSLEAELAGDADERPDRLAMRSEMRRLMESRIDQLPAAFRAVFVLRAVEEMSVEEVAAALQLPQATVRTRFFRARSLLRKALAGEIDMALADAFSFAGGRCDRIVGRVMARLDRERDDSPVHPMG